VQLEGLHHWEHSDLYYSASTKQIFFSHSEQLLKDGPNILRLTVAEEFVPILNSYLKCIQTNRAISLTKNYTVIN
jgi:hypothetical protein